MPKRIAGLPTVDVALAAVLLAVKLATLATGAQPGVGAASYVFAFCWTLPLAWRSARPLEVAAAIGATGVAEVWLTGYHDSVVALAAWVIVPYSLGAHSRSTGRLVAGIVLIAPAGIWVGIRQGGSGTANLLALTGLVIAPMLAGLWVRQMRLRSEALERLAGQLQREREERARAAVAEERARIARELHDEVAHAMSVIAVQADAAEGALARDPALVARPLVAIRTTARGALTDMRRVLGMLRADERGELSGAPGLAMAAALVEQARDGGLDVRLQVEGEPVPLPAPVDLAAYRVLQEGLTNARKHAVATRVDVVIRYDETRIAVEVSDNGVGRGSGGGTGHGLVGVRERIALLGGEFVAGPRARGFALSVSIPLR